MWIGTTMRTDGEKVDDRFRCENALLELLIKYSCIGVKPVLEYLAGLHGQASSKLTRQWHLLNVLGAVAEIELFVVFKVEVGESFCIINFFDIWLPVLNSLNYDF